MQAVRSGKSSKVKGETLKTGLPFSRLLVEMGALFVFTFFADVETLYRSVVAHHAGIDQTFGALLLMELEQGLGLDLLSVCLHSGLDFGLIHSRALRRIEDNIRVRH